MYRTTQSNLQHEQSREGVITGFVFLLGAITVLILVVMLAVCCYSRVAMKIDMKVTAERAHDHREGRLERRMSLQYDAK